LVPSFLEGNYGQELFCLKHIIHQISDKMDVLVADLHEAGATFMEEFTHQLETVAKKGQIGMDA